MARYIDADAFEVIRLTDVSEEFALGVQYAMELLDKAPTIEARPVWISVYDEMPEVSGMPCLVVAENRYGQEHIVKAFTNYESPIEFLTNEKEYDNFWHMWKVTHWMPLPEPPNGGADMRGDGDDQ